MTATATATVERPPPTQSGPVVRSIALPPGHISCMQCGIAVPEPTDHQRRAAHRSPAAEVIEVQTFAVAGHPVPLQRPVVTNLTRCPECQGRAERAAALVMAHPELARGLGSVAGYRVELALTGLAAIGITPTPAVLDATHRALLRYLAAPSGPVRWIARCAPVLEMGGGPGRCAPAPFATAPPASLAVLRAAYAMVLRERVAAGAPPVHLPPPPLRGSSSSSVPLRVEGGCLLCGVREVAMPAEQAARYPTPKVAAEQVWRSATMPAPTASDRIEGWLCPPCADVYERVGSFGPTLVEQAYLAHLEATGHHRKADYLRARLTGDDPPHLPAFAVLHHRAVTGMSPIGNTSIGITARPPSPSARPWGHLSRARRR